jgi:hypothetical protein
MSGLAVTGAYPHPDGLRLHPSGELATANFGEFTFPDVE